MARVFTTGTVHANEIDDHLLLILLLGGNGISLLAGICRRGPEKWSLRPVAQFPYRHYQVVFGINQVKLYVKTLLILELMLEVCNCS